MSDLRKKFAICDHVSSQNINELTEMCGYGSIGMLNEVVQCLTILKERINAGQVICYDTDSGSAPFGLTSFVDFIKINFPDYVATKVASSLVTTKDAFFDLENTDAGLDLMYTEQRECELFKPIANVSKKYQLVYLQFNHVVYIRNRKTDDIAPMISEHNNHYVYDINTGKIKEVM